MSPEPLPLPPLEPSPPEQFAEVCKIVNETSAICSLLYDINLLPEQTKDTRDWRYTACVTYDMLAHGRACAEAEREECAELAAITVCDTHLPTGVKIYGSRAAAAIRARGKK
jgi:hypothetical protein